MRESVVFSERKPLEEPKKFDYSLLLAILAFIFTAFLLCLFLLGL